VTAGLVRYALAAVARGWHVFPVTPGGKTPAIPAAHRRGDPLRGTCLGGCGRLGHGAHDATTDEAVIRSWWTHCTNANVGIATGPSGLLVIDLDIPKPGQAPPPEWDLPGVVDGVDVLAALCERAEQPLPVDTFCVTTRRGGLHLYFAAPTGPALGNTSGNNGRGLGWCIDTRGHGGYVVGPGSWVDLPDGAGRYQVLHRGDPAPLPRWLADRLTASTAPQAPAAAATVLHGVTRPVGYGGAALTAEVQRVLDAGNGTRNHTLNAAAYALGQLAAGGVLLPGLVEAALSAAANNIGLPAREAAATIASGLRAGAAHPRRGPA